MYGYNVQHSSYKFIALLVIVTLSSLCCCFFITASSENSFSSDSSHDYCVPPENISPPEPPPHSQDYDEVEGIYMEVGQNAFVSQRRLLQSLLVNNTCLACVAGTRVGLGGPSLRVLLLRTPQHCSRSSPLSAWLLRLILVCSFNMSNTERGFLLAKNILDIKTPPLCYLIHVHCIVIKSFGFSFLAYPQAYR